MAWDPKYAGQEKYHNKTKHVYKVISIRFNKSTDSDIMQDLEGKKAGTRIKELVRLGMKLEGDNNGSGKS